MKKNISINISGIIFHIEEDGYEILKKYLDSINKYFSTFEDSSEILADIESRIAEIFLGKLNEEKQVITAEDVNALMTTMGSVSDFKAAEAQNADEETTSSTGGPQGSEKREYASDIPPHSFSPSKTLMRDQKRKILGGVCAGLGNYFNVDPLWIRLLFALLFFAYGIILIVYVVMWIVVPGSFDLDEPVTGKKMFRDPERKILGGVSGGVAAFMNIDIVAIRVLFIVFTLLGGLGLFIYITLWIILPEARTLTDRVQMKGEPVTLSNIESTIKKSQALGSEEESTLTRVILFPFRLLGIILTALASILTPLLEVIRVAIGIIIVIVGISFAFSVIVTGGVLLGMFSAATFAGPWLVNGDLNFPIDALLRAFPAWTAVAAFLASLVPALFIILLGVSVVAKRIVFNAATGWTLFVIFFISAAMLAVGIPKVVFAFKEEGQYRVENNYTINGKVAVLRINEVGLDDYDATDLTLRGYEGTEFKLVQDFEAQGITRAQAIENAKMVAYTVEFKDSIFYFDSNIRFKPDAIFRAQRLEMILYVPYNFPFMMDEGIARFITQYVDCCGREGTDKVYRYTWKMTEDGLECLDCPNVNDDDDDENSITALRDFDEVEITGKFDLRISNGDHYGVEMVGPEREKSRYNIYRSGHTLVIEYQGKETFNWKAKDINLQEMRINITMPELEKLEATGYGSIRFDDFESPDMDVETRGPIHVRGDINTDRLTINMTGGSEAELSGQADKMNVRLEFASKLRAYDLDVNDAIVEVTGASSAKVNVTNHLEIEQGIASKVDYRGHPDVVIRD